MDKPENNLLGRKLEPKLEDILNDFNKILEKYGFSDTRVVRFTVKQEILSDMADIAHESVALETTCDSSDPPRCVP